MEITRSRLLKVRPGQRVLCKDETFTVKRVLNGPFIHLVVTDAWSDEWTMNGEDVEKILPKK